MIPLIWLLFLFVFGSVLFAYLVYPRPFVSSYTPQQFANVNHKKVDIAKHLPRKTGARYGIIGCGFLGKNIVNMLLLRGESNIKIFDMAAVTDYEDDKRVVSVKGNITKYEDVRKFLENVDVCYTTAAIIRFYERLPHQYKLSHDINVTGTDNIIRACKENNVSYLIATSSSTVTMAHDNTYLGMRESDPCPPKQSYNHYITTKGIAENNLLAANNSELSNKGVLHTAAIRPASAIFGYADGLNAQPLLSPNPVIFNGAHLFDYVYVENVAFAHLLLEDKMRTSAERVCGQAFLVSNGEPITRDEWYSMWASIRPQSRFKVMPVWFVWFLAYFSELVQRVGKGRISLGGIDKVTPAVLAFMTRNCSFSHEKAARLLGYSPIFSVAEGIQKTIEIAHQKGDIQ